MDVKIDFSNLYGCINHNEFQYRLHRAVISEAIKSARLDPEFRIFLPNDVRADSATSFVVGLSSGVWRGVQSCLRIELFALVHFYCRKHRLTEFYNDVPAGDIIKLFKLEHDGWESKTWKVLAYLFKGTQWFALLRKYGLKNKPEVWNDVQEFLKAEDPYKLRRSINNDRFVNPNIPVNDGNVNERGSPSLHPQTSRKTKNSAHSSTNDMQASLNTIDSVFGSSSTDDDNYKRNEVEESNSASTQVIKSNDYFKRRKQSKRGQEKAVSSPRNPSCDTFSTSLLQVNESQTKLTDSSSRNQNGSVKTRKLVNLKKNPKRQKTSVVVSNSSSAVESNDQNLRISLRLVRQPAISHCSKATPNDGLELEGFVSSAKPGMEIQLLAKEYKLSSTLLIDTPGVKIFGEIGQSKIVGEDGSSHQVIYISPRAVGCQLVNFSIESSYCKELRVGVYICGDETNIHDLQLINCGVNVWSSKNKLNSVKVVQPLEEFSDCGTAISVGCSGFALIRPATDNVFSDITILNFQIGVQFANCRANQVASLETENVRHAVVLENANNNEVKSLCYKWNAAIPQVENDSDVPAVLRIIGGIGNAVSGIRCTISKKNEASEMRQRFQFYWVRQSVCGKTGNVSLQNVFKNCPGPENIIDRLQNYIYQTFG